MRPLYPAVSMFALLAATGAMAGESSFWSIDWLFGDQKSNPAVVAEAKPTPPSKTGQAPQDAAPAPQQGTDAQPAETTETTNFENWILSCREFVEGPKKRTCAMTVAVRKTDTNRVVLSWTIRQGEKGQPISVVETLPGVSIGPGIQLKLENGSAPHKVPIEICEPNWCSGTLPMDKAFVQEVTASSKVSIIVTSSAGQPITFEFPIKGFEKAYAKM
jgi:invasion protein IalB